MFLKRGAMKEFLVTGDVVPSQSTLPTAEASILVNGENCVTRHAAQAADAWSGTRCPRCTDVAHVGVPTNTIAAASRNPSQSSSNNNQPSQTPQTYIQGLAPSMHTFLTRVSGNKAGDCPYSESDNEEENPSQGFYANSLFTYKPWTIRARTGDDQ
jgi:hypothetical protein